MKIHRMLSEMGNDFYATFICEHCQTITPKKSGYHDNWFHTRVIPAMNCQSCGKNRQGELTPERETLYGPMKGAESVGEMKQRATSNALTTYRP